MIQLHSNQDLLQSNLVAPQHESKKKCDRVDPNLFASDPAPKRVTSARRRNHRNTLLIWNAFACSWNITRMMVVITMRRRVASTIGLKVILRLVVGSFVTTIATRRPLNEHEMNQKLAIYLRQHRKNGDVSHKVGNERYNFVLAIKPSQHLCVRAFSRIVNVSYAKIQHAALFIQDTTAPSDSFPSRTIKGKENHQANTKEAAILCLSRMHLEVLVDGEV